MSSIGRKAERLRLDPVAYEALRQRILRRDGWRCQSCGTMANLEVHHKQFRSHSGDDSEESPSTLAVSRRALRTRFPSTTMRTRGTDLWTVASFSVPRQP